jgi:DNA-binding NarL/FixJ family response regulator
MVQGEKHIILAEDDEDDSAFFEEALRTITQAPEFIRAKDGVELTGLLEKMPEKPYLIFLDLNMPRKNGTQCLHEIRQNKEFSKVPVIVLSTTSTEEIINSVYSSGANLYIQKPSDFRVWIKAIQKVLEIDWDIQIPYRLRRDQFILSEF